MKVQYAQSMNRNLKIFGISKAKNLTDFVTTEKDAMKGNNRLPLAMARLHNEDVLKEDGANQVGMKIDALRLSEDDELTRTMQQKMDAIARSSSYVMP